MRIISIGLILTGTGLATISLASDLPTKSKTQAAPIISSKYDWNGFYGSGLLGLSAGHKSRDIGFVYYSDWTGADLTPADDTGGDYLDATGDDDFAKSFSGSLKLGYNIQLGSDLVGFELGGTVQQLQFHGLALRDYCWPIYDYCDSDIPIDGRLDLNSYVTLSTRLGHIFNNQTLVYVSGGVAVGQFNYELTNISGYTEVIDPTSPSKDSVNAIGYVFGTGIEHRLDKNWSLRLHYEYVRFDDVSFHYEYPRSDIVERMNQGILSTFKSSTDVSNIALGLTYKF